jgi:hypothetical protein
MLDHHRAYRCSTILLGGLLVLTLGPGVGCTGTVRGAADAGPGADRAEDTGSADGHRDGMTGDRDVLPEDTRLPNDIAVDDTDALAPPADGPLADPAPADASADAPPGPDAAGTPDDGNTACITASPRGMHRGIYVAPTAAERFNTLPVGASLPDDAECAARVRRNGYEPRPSNDIPNQVVPTTAELANFGSAPDRWSGATNTALALRQRVTGGFTGTTDEIIQWIACKWGIDEDLVRAQAVQESSWYQKGCQAGQGLGDYHSDMSFCPPGSWDGTGCFQSYGIVQVKWFYDQHSWPLITDSTAFNLDLSFAWRRTCFEGLITFLPSNYTSGDLPGCVGNWFSGGWHDAGADSYAASVMNHVTAQDWASPSF